MNTPHLFFIILFLLVMVTLALANPRQASSNEEPPWWLFLFIFLFIFCFYGALFLFIAAYYVFLIWALVDIARAQNEGNWKLLWALVAIFGQAIGLAVYFFVGRHERIPPKPKEAVVR
jgi:D-alanyl-lipoteichoic acid acyltransferase DltB (MBOAT superfamily)